MVPQRFRTLQRLACFALLSFTTPLACDEQYRGARPEAAAGADAGADADAGVEPDSGLIYVEEAEEASLVNVGQGFRGTLEGADNDGFSVELQEEEVLVVYVELDFTGDKTIYILGEDFTTARLFHDLQAGDRFEIFASRTATYSFNLSSREAETSAPYSFRLESRAPLVREPLESLPHTTTSGSSLRVRAFEVTLETPAALAGALEFSDGSREVSAVESLLLWDPSSGARRLERGQLDVLPEGLFAAGAQLDAGRYTLLLQPFRARSGQEVQLTVATDDDSASFPLVALAEGAEITETLTAGDTDHFVFGSDSPTLRLRARVEVLAPDPVLTLWVRDQRWLTATPQDGRAALEFEVSEAWGPSMRLEVTSASGQPAEYTLRVTAADWPEGPPLELDGAPLAGEVGQGTYAWFQFVPPAEGFLLSRLDPGSRALLLAFNSANDTTWTLPDTPNGVSFLGATRPLQWGVRHATFEAAPFAVEDLRFIPWIDTFGLTQQRFTAGPLDTLTLPTMGSARLTAEINGPTQNLHLTLPILPGQRLLLALALTGDPVAPLTPRADGATLLHTYRGGGLRSPLTAWEFEGGAEASNITFAVEGDCPQVGEETPPVYSCPIRSFTLYIQTIEP